MTPGNSSGLEPDLVPRPDPTKLTTEAVDRASEVFRREILSLRETIETRLTAADDDRDQLRIRLRDLPVLYETFTAGLREELFRQDTHDREMLTQRIDDMDTARIRSDEKYMTELEHRRREFMADLAGSREVLEQRLAGMDRALELMAGETARMQAAADTADRRSQRDMNAMVTGLRELIEQRLSAMDLATKVLASSVEKFPSDVDRAAGNIREVVLGEIKRVQSVTEEKFMAIDGTFSSNALALTAALAAQKEAAAEQNKSNTLAITKSESSTKETIAANAVQGQTGLASLENQFDDIKERVVRIESMGVGVAAHKTETQQERTLQHSSSQLGITAVAVIIAVISIAVTIILATRGH